MVRKFFAGLWRIVAFPFRMLGRLVRGLLAAPRRLYDFLTHEPEDRPVGEVFEDALQQPVLALDHLEALRKHLLRMLIAMGIGVIACGAYAQEIIAWLAQPIGGLGALQAIEPTETVGVFMKVAVWGGFSLTLPYLAFELWLFAAPGVGARSRQLSLLAIPLSLLLFGGGMYFAYRFLLPPALTFLLHFMEVETVPRLSSYVNFIIGLLFWIGLAFETPLIVFTLALMGFVQPGGLLRQWRMAVVGIAILAAAVTPTVDPVNMFLVMAPMIALYFLSIGLAYGALALRRPRPSRPV
ncbi:MAG: twin-arginine translocase subunit TatC [Anaerolineales bacterium]